MHVLGVKEAVEERILAVLVNGTVNEPKVIVQYEPDPALASNNFLSGGPFDWRW